MMSTYYRGRIARLIRYLIYSEKLLPRKKSQMWVLTIAVEWSDLYDTWYIIYDKFSRTRLASIVRSIISVILLSSILYNFAIGGDNFTANRQEEKHTLLKQYIQINRYHIGNFEKKKTPKKTINFFLIKVNVCFSNSF